MADPLLFWCPRCETVRSDNLTAVDRDGVRWDTICCYEVEPWTPMTDPTEVVTLHARRPEVPDADLFNRRIAYAPMDVWWEAGLPIGLLLTENRMFIAPPSLKRPMLLTGTSDPIVTVQLDPADIEESQR